MISLWLKQPPCYRRPTPDRVIICPFRYPFEPKAPEKKESKLTNKKILSAKEKCEEFEEEGMLKSEKIIRFHFKRKKKSENDNDFHQLFQFSKISQIFQIFDRFSVEWNV